MHAITVIFLLVLSLAAPAAGAAGLSTHAARAPRTVSTCPPEGSAKGPKTKALNVLKARTKAPTAADIDPEISLDALLEDGDDTGRFDSSQAAEITGYVVTVKVGGVETANCGAKDPEHRDTHIELVLSKDETAETSRVIVEVTPRWRAKMKAASASEDWSTDGLKSQLLHKWLTVQGWILFDSEHAAQAEHTNPGNPKNWRATVWEIHPITAMSVSDEPPP